MHSVCGTFYLRDNLTNCAAVLASMYAAAGVGFNRSTDPPASTAPPNGWNGSVATTTGNFNIWDDAAAGGRPATVGASPLGLRFDLETVVQLYLISLLIAFGVIGNIVSIIVLRQDRERRDTLFLLQALAVADALYLVAAIMRYPVKHLVRQQPDGSNRYVDMQPIVFPLLKTFQTITVWMMVLVTVDRFTCVCRPLDSPRWFNPSTRPLYAILVFVVGFIYNIPSEITQTLLVVVVTIVISFTQEVRQSMTTDDDRYADSCVHRWIDSCTRLSGSFMIYREAFNSPYYFNIYIDLMTILLVCIGPLITLIVMTGQLIRAIRQSRRRRRCQDSQTSSSRTWSPSNDVMLMQPARQLQQQQQQQQLLQLSASTAASTSTSSDRNATIVLIIIVVVFIVCETPELVSKLITFFERNVEYGLDYEQHGYSLRILVIVNELLMVVNSSVNFVVYVAFGRRFRRIMRETFRFSFRFSSDATAVTRDTPQGGAGGGQQPAAGGGGGWPAQQPAHYPPQRHPVYNYPMRFNYAATPGVRQYHQYQRGPPPQAIMLRPTPNYSNHNGL